MKKKERRELENKLYDILHKKYDGAIVVKGDPVHPFHSVWDFSRAKGIVDMLYDDIYQDRNEPIYEAFEKWIVPNRFKYSFYGMQKKWSFEQTVTTVRFVIWALIGGIGIGTLI